jgi:aldehyde:ferredoxin oxidoreductase
MQPILKVDLSTGALTTFEVPVAWEHEFLGAASLAARLLYDHLTPELDPLSPEAPLLFLNGPLTGSAGPAVGRFVVCGKSPATWLWAESNVGGFWGPELRKAGFDGVWLTGKAKRPVYLWIHNGEVEIRKADHVWGFDTYATQDALQEELPEKNVRLAVIGQGGEALLPYALILCDHGRVAGRTGLGAVMGAKNVKAVAVKGTQPVELINWEAFQPVRSRANRALKEHNQTLVLRDLGSGGGSDYFDYLGEMPKKYFQQAEFEGTERVSGSTMAETILKGFSTCHACVIACGRVVALSDGKKRKGPEYETTIGFGPNLMINDLEAITLLGEKCDRYGLDSISMSNVIGLAFKLWDMEVIGTAETDGLELDWGDPEIASRGMGLK